MRVTEQELGEWTLAFCTALDSHDGRHSLLDHLQQAHSQQSNPEFRSVLANVQETVAQGYSLSHAFSQHRDVFSEAFVTTVKYGEIYGEVDIALRRYVERPEDRAARCRLPVPRPVLSRSDVRALLPVSARAGPLGDGRKTSAK